MNRMSGNDAFFYTPDKKYIDIDKDIIHKNNANKNKIHYKNIEKSDKTPNKLTDSFIFSFNKFIEKDLKNPKFGKLPNQVLHLNPKDPNVSNLLKDAVITLEDEKFLQAKISFNQGNIINSQLPEDLQEFVLRYQGLCELICNKVLIDDLLGKDNANGNYLKQNISPENLNKDDIKKSHLLNVYSIFYRMVAFLFGIYPDNIFSVTDQWNLVESHGAEKQVNQKLLKQGLEDIKVGTTLKLEVFSKTNLNFSGHSLLVKKVAEDKFIFFDPNSGEHRDLSIEELASKINEQLKQWNGTDLFFTKGEDYINRLKYANILDNALPNH